MFGETCILGSRSEIKIPVINSVFELPATAARTDMSSYKLVAWTYDPDRVPAEVESSIPEPKETFVDRAPPLYLREEELIEPQRDTLRFTATIHIFEVQDYHPRSDSEDESLGMRRDYYSDSARNDYPGFDEGSRSLKPWLKVYWFP